MSKVIGYTEKRVLVPDLNAAGLALLGLAFSLLNYNSIVIYIGGNWASNIDSIRFIALALNVGLAIFCLLTFGSSIANVEKVKVLHAK